MAIDDIVINATAQQIEDMATRRISQEITEDSSAAELASAKAVYNALMNAGTGGGTGGGLEPLIVTMNDSMDKASRNFEEIRSHVLAGGDVFLDTFVGYIALNDLSYMETAAIFSKVTRNGTNIFIIDDAGTVQLQHAVLVTTDELGDLDSALTNILDYAQSLVSGGES